MKTAEEKIQFKNHFFKLGQGRIIPFSDEKYWEVFWNEPRELADVFDLLTPYDVQTIRDQNLPNILLLVHVLSLKSVAFSQNFTARKHLELLNCLRLLSKVIPFIYELPNYADEIEPRLFWSTLFNPLDFLLAGPDLTLNPTGPSIKPPGDSVLAVSLITSLVQLLLTPGFAVDRQSINLTTKVTLFEPGIGGSRKYQAPNPIYDSNRVEVLRTLIALISSSFYDKPTEVISKGSRFLTFIVTSLPRTELVSLICSLFNITCRAARKPEESGLVYDNITLAELRYLCVTYSVQLLASMLVYPIPSLDTTSFLIEHNLTTSARPLNMVRIFFGKLSKDSELLFMASHLLNILKFPLQASDEGKARTSKTQPSPWALEASLILWELLQCNKRFRNTLSDRLVLKLVPYLLYHVFAFFDVPQYSNIVKVSAYFLFYISTQHSWAQALIFRMSDAVTDSFPPEFRPPHSMSTRDFSIIQICTILSSVAPDGQVQLSPDLQTFLMPTLVDILYNITSVVNKNIDGSNDTAKRMANENPYGGLSYLACNALTQLLVKLSTKSFLLAGPRNAEMLALILRALCSAATKQPAASRMLLFTFMKNEKIYNSIWSVIHSIGNEYFYGENMKLMNVREDDENLDPNDDPQSPMFQKSFSRPPMISRDEQSITSVTTNEDHFPGFKDSVNNSLNNSMISILPEESEEEEIDEDKAMDEALRPPPPTGMSLKAREKLPQDSTLSQAWGGNDALRIIITILIPHIKLELKDLWSKNDDCTYDNFHIVRQIELSNLELIIELNRTQINYDFLPETPIDKLPFHWSHLSLGWYASTLYWDIYSGTETIKKFVRTNKSLINSISSSIAVLSKFASSWSGLGGGSATAGPEDQITIDYVERGLCSLNLWEATNVKLFNIKPNDNDMFFNSFGLKFGSASPNPGGVNDITNSLARRFSDFRMSSRTSVSAASTHHLTIEEQADGARLLKRDSVSSLHSLNTLNRTRSNTPRNSLSI